MFSIQKKFVKSKKPPDLFLTKAEFSSKEFMQ